MRIGKLPVLGRAIREIQQDPERVVIRMQLDAGFGRPKRGPPRFFPGSDIQSPSDWFEKGQVWEKEVSAGKVGQLRANMDKAENSRVELRGYSRE